MIAYYGIGKKNRESTYAGNVEKRIGDPVMVLQFSKTKWDKMMEQGKTLGEILFENDIKKREALDVAANKKSRVTAAQFASYEAIANTLHSPQLNNKVTQLGEEIKYESSNALDVEIDGHSNFPVAQGGVDDFVKKYEEKHKGILYSDREALAAQPTKHSDRDELLPSEYNRLTRKKPIKVSDQELAMIGKQRKSKYSSMEEYDIPIIDFFRIGDYRIPNPDRIC